MTDWYYHAPGQGRVGPLSVEQMRQCYRERRIDRETLAWHDGLREWQPVERMIEELGLSGVQPDTSLPPPVPPRPAAATASHAGPMRPAVAPPPSNRSGCIIAIVVLGIVGLVVVAILAAIALPAYQDYVKRTKAAQSGQSAQSGQPSQVQQKVYTFDAERMAKTDALARELVTAAMREFYAANDNLCPDVFEFEKLMVRYPRYQGSEENGWFGIEPAQAEGNQCAYELRYHSLGPEVQDKTLRYEVNIVGEEVKIVCRNQTLPDSRLPPNCHVI
jgi:GYF domain 2